MNDSIFLVSVKDKLVNCANYKSVLSVAMSI